MAPGFLADDRIERHIGERHRSRVALFELHATNERNSARETARIFDAAGGEVDSGDAATAPNHKPAGRPTYPAANINHVVIGEHACGAGESIDRCGS